MRGVPFPRVEYAVAVFRGGRTAAVQVVRHVLGRSHDLRGEIVSSLGVL